MVTFSFLFIVTSVLQQELESVFKYLSYWAVWITILALIFSNNAGQWPYPSDKTAIDYKILANLFNTTAMNTNQWVLLLSFTIIMPSELMNPENYKSFTSVYWLFRAVLIHTVPLVVSTINSYILTDSVIYLTDIWIVPLVAYTYLLV